MNLIQRILSPTPGFFKKIRAAGLAIGTVGGSILAASAVLPALLVKCAGYMVVAGSIAAAVSQAATQKDDPGTANKTQV